PPLSVSALADLPGSPKTRGFSSRSPQLDAFRKAEVSLHGSLDSHWHRPLHITSFLSHSMLTRRDGLVNVNEGCMREGPDVSKVCCDTGATLHLCEVRQRLKSSSYILPRADIRAGWPHARS